MCVNFYCQGLYAKPTKPVHVAVSAYGKTRHNAHNTQLTIFAVSGGLCGHYDAFYQSLPQAVGGYGFCGRSIQALFIVTAKKINVFNYNRRYSRVMEKLECGILVYQVSFFFYYDTHYIEQRMDFYPKSYFVRTTLPYFVGLFPYRTEQIFLLYYLLSSLCCCFFSTLLWFLVTLIRILWWIKF